MESEQRRMFYKLDSTRLTLREYAWSTPVLALPVVLLLKLFRVRLSLSAAIPDSIEPFRAERDEIPEDILEKIGELEEEMRRCGFIDPAYHWICDPYGSRRLCMATFRHTSGTAIGQITFGRAEAQNPPKETLSAAFVTCYRDGTYFVTTNRKPEMLSSPLHDVQRHIGASVIDLWQLHCQQVSLKTFGKGAFTVSSQEEMLELAEKEEEDGIAFQVERGVLVPHDEAQQKTIETVMTAVGSEADRAFAAVYDEIDRLVNRKGSWGSVIVALILSIIMYFVMRDQAQGWRSIATIMGVMFFHECGHLAAMWVFRYRNLRMLFIPFLGAAVSMGQNYNVPGWKKSIVSLAGPLPGIAVGSVLGIVAAVNHWPNLLLASAMLLLLNGFNLLPIMPLDGGQVMHAVLFSRHPVIDVVFRAIAGVLLILTGLAGGRGLMWLGIFMLLGLKMNYRIGSVVHRLRQRGFDAHSPDARTIPVATAYAIYQELRPALPANANTRTSAQFTLNAFELLNAKPPGVLGSMALIGVHGFSLLAAIVAGFVIALIVHGP
jgi:Zn-dependent protease